MIRPVLHWFAEQPRPIKRVWQVAFDMLTLALVAYFSFRMRLGPELDLSSTQFALVVLAPITALPFFVRLGLYRAVLRYLTEHALWTVVQAMVLGTLAWVALAFLFQQYGGTGMPRSVPIIYCTIGIVVVAVVRFAMKWSLGWLSGEAPTERRTLLYGAGRAGTQLLAALRAGGDRSVLGFLDDNAAMHGRTVGGVTVFPPASLGDLAKRMGITDVILCVPSASAARRMEIVVALAANQVKVRALPAITDIASGQYSVNSLREIDLEDLLGRVSVDADPVLLGQAIAGQTVLITGAGGSIGSELARLVANHDPARLTLVDSSELALYNIMRSLSGTHPDVDIRAVLASVTDRQAMTEVFSQGPIGLVLHCAAYKQVPLVESNILSGVRNNVLGTELVAERAYAHGALNVVLISTDKAVNPVSIMGATKRWSERIIAMYAAKARAAETGQNFLAVRFGNVLGSAGSVVPLFREQIEAGGPVTVTDPRMTRYFMAVQEAAELIVQAAALSRGGETFLLDMGEPISILSLAENMIRLGGFRVKNADNPDGDIEIRITGARPGERLHEELFYDPANSLPTAHPKIHMARLLETDVECAEAILGQLRTALNTGDDELVRKLLFTAFEQTSSTGAIKASGKKGAA